MDRNKWIKTAFLLTFFISLIISGISNIIANSAALITLIIITIVILAIGVMFDMIGTAALTASESSFHAKAANKIKGAKEAIKLIKNSSTISSFCNDVIGDICGIVSGSMGAIIAITLSDKISPDYKALVALVVASVISSLTVGFKAIGKKYAIKKSDDIIFIVAKTISKFTKEK